ncbi:putative CtpA-like serine protease [bacterium BMS3Bbin12]|nr:putative CtpA-like serine protease [bacterium BMS3Abin12]GBE48320.1 putative CtpA-like serine protease [bacterium BMS3Bbin12]GBE51208.1 putative CtpA-like serine protease [bacterium BMS3Bbin13]HDJ85944.1 S41 family peptidase [Chromatiales bacterium]
MTIGKRSSHLRVVAVGILWLLSGVVTGVVVDRQILAGVVPPDRIPVAAAPDFRLMAEAWNLIDGHYVDRAAIKPTKMTYAAISGMVDSLGDTGHSTFLSPEMVKEARDAVQGHFAGIGAEVRMRDRHVVVVAPLDGSPAQKAGLRPGDIIFKVGGKDVAGESLEQVVRKIRGPAGTTVVLSLRAPKTGKTRNVPIVRAVIKLHSVTWHMLPGTRVADVRIASFSEGTSRALEKALAQVRAHGAAGLILDLRNNPGGLLSQAIGVASQFLHGGNVLLEKNVNGQVHRVPVLGDVRKTRLPMVVLINPGTASASEIVAGALKDAARAELVGEKTFGTGTVLQEFPLSNGAALMLAVEEWLTPDGHTIWHRGIEPQKVVSLPPDVLPLRPQDEKRLTAAEFRKTKDKQMIEALRAVEVKMHRKGA